MEISKPVKRLKHAKMKRVDTMKCNFKTHKNEVKECVENRRQEARDY